MATDKLINVYAPRDKQLIEIQTNDTNLDGKRICFSNYARVADLLNIIVHGGKSDYGASCRRHMVLSGRVWPYCERSLKDVLIINNNNKIITDIGDPMTTMDAAFCIVTLHYHDCR